MTVMLLVAALAAPALAGPGDRIADAPPADTKRICRREIPTGSIMPGRLVCLTRAEWRTIADSREDSTDAFRRRPHPNMDTRPE